MATRNSLFNSEIEPRVPRHPTPALTDTVPTVPEVSLAFDTPHQKNSPKYHPKTPTVSATYAQWKQQVPHKSISNKMTDSGIIQKLSPSNSSAESPRRQNIALVTIEKPQNQEFTKDSRLKFYQKLTSGPSSAEVNTHPLNSIKTPSRRLQRSLSVGSQAQKITPSDLVLKQKNQLSLNPEERINQVKTTCDCHSHQNENTEIINKLLSLVQSQNAQIQMLQGQVETLLTMRNERSRELNDYQRLPHHNVSTNTLDPTVQNPRFQYQNSPRKIQEFEDKQRDEMCKQLIKEKKVSIGVMTSFELTVQDSVVYNIDNVPSTTDHHDKSPHSIGNKNIPPRTPVSVAKVHNGPLEQIIEDSESHLSSTIQASNNFNTCSSVKKSLQGNFQGDTPNCMESPVINNSIVPQNQVNKPCDDLEVTNGHKKSTNEDNESVNQQKLSQNSQNAPSNAQCDVIKKTPKVGWTLYDNVMCQVNEILHNTQEEEIREESNNPSLNQSKLVVNGIQQSVEQLKVFGFTFAENSGYSGGRSLLDNRRMAPIPIDASYYPRLDYQANVFQTSCSASDTSLHMKALAMKYLGSKQLPNMVTNMVLSNIQGNTPGGCVHEVPKINYDPRIQESPKALPDTQRVNYLINSKQSPQNGDNSHNILDISSLKRQPKLL